jgi:hypothetical protein
VRKVDKLTVTFLAYCLDNVGTLTSHRPIELTALLRGKHITSAYQHRCVCVYINRDKSYLTLHDLFKHFNLSNKNDYEAVDYLLNQQLVK